MNDKFESILSGPVPPLICAIGVTCVARHALASGEVALAISFSIIAVLFIGSTITGIHVHRLIKQNRANRRLVLPQQWCKQMENVEQDAQKLLDKCDKAK